MAIRDADIKLLFGVATGGPDGDSAALIKEQLTEIMSKIKVGVTLKTDNFHAQINKGLKAANAKKDFSVSISKIEIKAGAISAFKKKLSDVINTLSLDKGVSVTLTSKDIGKIAGDTKEVKRQTEEAAKAAAEYKVQMAAMDQYSRNIKSNLKAVGASATDTEKPDIAAIQARYNEWLIKMETARSMGVGWSTEQRSAVMDEAAAIQMNIDALVQQQQARENDRRAAEAEAAATKAASDEAEKEAAKRAKAAASIADVEKAYGRIESYMRKNPRISGDNLTQLQLMRDRLSDIILRAKQTGASISDIDKAELRRILSEFAALDQKITLAGQKGKTLSGIIASAYEKFGGWMLVTKSLTLAIRSIGRMVTSVRDLDAAMTELKKVTDETNAVYTRFFDEASVRAKKLGATLADTINATADFARLGYTISESANLADAALVYKNVGDGIEDISESSESIISTMKAFGIEAKNAMLIVDKFNEVGNNFAISSQGVGEALKRSASTLAAGNNSLDESIALITAANSVVQDPDVVGTTMKTLSMYLRAAKTEAEEAGESTEGMANSVSELRSEILALTGNRVDIQLNDSTFKNTYQIMKELAAVWGDLTDISRANILEQIAGKRNANAVSALLNNFDIAESVLETAADSAGSALAENEKYIDSINGRIAQFQAAFERLSSSIVQSDLVKDIVSTGTSILEILDKIINALGAMPSLISTITSAVTVFASTKGTKLGLFDAVDGRIVLNDNSIGQYVASLQKIVQYNKLAKGAQGAFADSLTTSDAHLAGYLKTIRSGSASMSGYKAYCKAAGTETKAFGASAKLAAVGATALNVAINAFISFGVGLVIQGLVTLIQKLANAEQEAIEKTRELNAEFANFKKSNSDNIRTLESMRVEFEELSKGVSQYGDNITLTADEYARYNEMVQEIIGMSPSLSAGYDQENGYLADKNNLIERAIELQEQEYQAELRKMALTSNMAERMKGYAADYNGSQVDFSNADQRLTPAVYKMINYDKDHTAVRAVMEALGIDNIESELEKYTLQGNVQWGQFWSDYSDIIVDNFDKVVASLNYSDFGFESEGAFDKAVQAAQEAVEKYAQARNEIASINTDVANDLQYAAQANDAYSKLNTESKQLVTDFVNGFDVNDVFRKTVSGDYMQDADLINAAKARISAFIDKLTPEVQEAISSLFQTQDLFNVGNIGAHSYKATINQILADLKNAGFDDETVKQLRLSLNIDSVETQLTTVKNGITDLTASAVSAVDKMSSEDLKFAYEIIAANGSMTFDELQSAMQRVKLESSDTVNVLDFSSLTNRLDEAKNGLDSIISAMDKLRNGTAMTKQELASLALQYPKLLEESQLFTDNSIDGQKRILDTVLDVKEKEYDAQLDAKIAELKASEQLINDQIEIEQQKAAIIAEIENATVNGRIDQEFALSEKLSELNDLEGQNFVSLQDGVLEVNAAALTEKLRQDTDYEQLADENVWEPMQHSIEDAHAQGLKNALGGIDSFIVKAATKTSSYIKNVLAPMSEAVASAAQGIDPTSAIHGALAGAMNGALGGNNTIASGSGFRGTSGKTIVDNMGLDEWISKQQKRTAERIAALDDLGKRTARARENLEKLKGLDLTSIYGSRGSGSGSGSSSKKNIEEYFADIDKYYEAVKRLEAAQERSSSLEKKIKYTDDTAEKIRLSGELIDSYREQADAEKNLMDLKRQTIAGNVAALRELGFEVAYNSESNELLIKNQEHLNELTASSAGKYDTLQEATNALRKETESLIDATEQLNDDNIDAAASIEDLGYSIRDVKSDIVGYIEDVYGKQIDAYQKIIDKRKEMIQSAKDEFDYESDIADKVKEIADLQARIDQLALDDSRSARAERNSLQEQLREKQKDLADTQLDHSVDSQTDALDKMADKYETDKNAELDLIRETVNASDELWSAFYDTILGKNVTIGESISANIANAWINAAKAVREYGASVQSVGSVGTVVSNVPKFHDGGVVNEANIGKDEALAILQKGEVVLNEQKQTGLYRMIDFQAELSKRLGVAIGELRPSLAPISLGNLTNRSIQEPNAQQPGIIFEPRIEVNISHNGNMDMTQAQEYGNKIASVAIDRLYDAFERRGINSTRGARLKP